MQQYLLIHETIPDLTVMVILNPETIKAAVLTEAQLIAAHGMVQNSDVLTDEQEATHDAVNNALASDGAWANLFVFRSDDPEKYSEPVALSGETKVIYMGFAL